MSNSVFSLRRLSDDVRHQVIKSFDYVELISYSLISRNSKVLVQSFNLELDRFIVKIHVDLLMFSMTFKGCDECHKFQIYHANRVSARLFRLNVITNVIKVERPINTPWPNNFERFSLSTPDLSFIGWFEHFKFLLKLNETKFSATANEEVFDTVKIRSLFPKWTTVSVCCGRPRYYRKIFDLFVPCVKNIELDTHLGIARYPRKVLFHNFNRFTSWYQLTLDDLLILNAFVIFIRSFSISDINRFVKEWIRGSNPRMKYIRIYENDAIDETKLLKGIKHQIMPDGVERRTRDGRDVVGNIDIRNNKGILATINVFYGQRYGIDMTVWN